MACLKRVLGFLFVLGLAGCLWVIPPSTTLSAQQTTFQEADTLTLTALSKSSGVDRLVFYEGERELSRIENSGGDKPFRAEHVVSFTPTDNGVYQYRVKAFSGDKELSSSKPLTVTVAMGDTAPCPNKPSAPNFILIVTDDQSYEQLEHMSLTQERLVRQGTSFTNAFVVDPYCCPSRASILRGQYPHNHKVLNNFYPAGGFRRFYEQGLEKSTLATWLQQKGYYTGLVGKYLNQYPHLDVVPLSYVPPGWNEWAAMRGPGDYYNHSMIRDEVPRDYVNDYATDRYSQAATSFVRRRSCGSKPFFLYIAPFAPHAPFNPALRHRDLFPNLTIPKVPSLNEADVRDKPSWLQAESSLTRDQLVRYDEAYRNRVRMLQAVDEMVENLVATLEAKGVLDNTYLLFTSDNGFHMGHHRLKPGKQLPYEEDIRVPFVLRGPGVPANARNDALIENIDIAPTFAALAGADVPDFVDGESFAPLFSAPETPWKPYVLVQGWNSDGRRAYASVRSDRYKYTEWYAAPFGGPTLTAPEYELYDLQTDPYELDNLYPSAEPRLVVALRAKLAQLSSCAGGSCREIR
jgi:N-acetylglucosamine-6-sulfatase